MLAKDCLEAFRVACNLRRLSPRTIKSYCNNTALFLNYLENHDKIIVLEEVCTPHIKKFKQHLIVRGLSPGYINGIPKCLRAFFKYAVSEEYISVTKSKEKITNIGGYLLKTVGVDDIIFIPNQINIQLRCYCVPWGSLPFFTNPVNLIKIQIPQYWCAAMPLLLNWFGDYRSLRFFVRLLR